MMENTKIIRLCDENGKTALCMDDVTFSKILRTYNGKQAAIIFYMIDNMDTRTNFFYGTYKSISEAVGISRPTVTKVLKMMQEKNLVKPKQFGVWELDLQKIA